MEDIGSPRTLVFPVMMGNNYVAGTLILFAIFGLASLPTQRVPMHHATPEVELARTEAGQGDVQGKDPQSSGSKLLPGASGEQRAPLSPRVRISALFSTMVFFINFTLWIILAMAFNAYSKAYVRATANPVGLVVLQGAVGVFVLGSLACLGVLSLRFTAGLSSTAAWSVGVSSFCHALQALMTNFAVFIGGVAITNALKAMEPVAAAILSYFVLGKRISVFQCGALVIIVSGILLLTSKSTGGSTVDNDRTLLSAVFTWAAVFANAMRNVAVKKENSIPPHQTLFACSAVSTMFGLVLMFVSLVGKRMSDLEGLECNRSRAGDGDSWIRMEGVMAALSYVGFQFASFNLLALLSPVGHAVGNSCKRVVVFASGIVVLGEVISARQLAGTAVALSGVLVYSLARRW